MVKRNPLKIASDLFSKTASKKASFRNIVSVQGVAESIH